MLFVFRQELVAAASQILVLQERLDMFTAENTRTLVAVSGADILRKIDDLSQVVQSYDAHLQGLQSG